MEGEVIPGADGLQYLCTKYSVLITRLREEVLVRQRAQDDAQHLEGKLRDEASAWHVQRAGWECERRALRDELASLQAHKLQTQELTAVASRQLAQRCERLQEACVEEAHKSMHVLDQAAVGSETLLRQGEALARLRQEHCELQAQHSNTQEELVACREYLTRWRHRAAELEGKADAVAHAREEAEGRARLLQEEMRQALRSASTARAREASASMSAGKGERELRAREARLTAVRCEGQRHARRASSAERRLAKTEGCEAAYERLSWQVTELRARLESESRACEGAQLEAARAEAATTRAVAAATEARSELKAGEAGVAVANHQVADYEEQRTLARGRLEQLERERVANASAFESLRSELLACRSDREESRCVRDRLSSELTEAKRRCERSNPQFADMRRRLGSAEESLSRAQAEVAEERQARERCHLEAIRAGDKLRAARAQGQQLRERIRSLEEVELRYPSRQRQALCLQEAEHAFEAEPSGASTASGAGPWQDIVWGREAAAAPRAPAALSQHTTPHPTDREPEQRAPRGRDRQHSAERCAERLGEQAHEAALPQAVFDFVAQEDQRLLALGGSASPGEASHCRGGGGTAFAGTPRAGAPPLTVAGSWEEQPRARAPAKASLGFAPEEHCRREPGCASVARGTSVVDPELAALLAAEPRVLQARAPPPVDGGGCNGSGGGSAPRPGGF